jgi:uncharacterized protein YciI
MAYFYLRLNGPRPDFALTMNDEEKTLMGTHVQWARGFVEQGVILVLGPVLDPAGPFGVAIVKGDSIEAVKATFDNDPVIVAKRGFRYDIFPMNAVVANGL